MNTFLAKSKTTDKTCFLVGDLNFNLIDYQSNAKVRNFVNLIFQHSLVPIVNKTTRVTKTTQHSLITSSITSLQTRKMSLVFSKQIKTISVKRKILHNPWMTKGLLKSSKRKQKLYEKFLKKETPRNESIYKAYKSLWESLKKKSKKNYYARRLESYKNDIKKSWDVIKEIIVEAKSTKVNFP